MIQCNSYELVYLQEIPYLIPYGQQTANLQKSIRLNETGVLIWNELLQKKTLEEILQKLLDTYELSENDRPFVQQDLDRTIAQLENLHIITTSAASDTDSYTQKGIQNTRQKDVQSNPQKKDQKSTQNDHQKDFCFHIGPLTISVEGSKSLALSAFFKDFFCSANTRKPMQHIVIREQKPKKLLPGCILIKRADIQIEELPFFYRICIPDDPRFYEMRITKDAAFVEIFCDAAIDVEFLFHMIRFPVLLLAQTKECFFLHSASILYKEKAWLFSGSSGTGKSTHTRLWHTFLDTPYLNGDLNMLGIKNEKYTVYGQPWCGTSKIYTAIDHPLGGIVFLKQAKENRWQSMTSDQKVLQLLNRLISPSWTKDMLHKNITFSKKISQKLPLFSLECTATKEACYVAQDGILFHLKNEKKL